MKTSQTIAMKAFARISGRIFLGLLVACSAKGTPATPAPAQPDVVEVVKTSAGDKTQVEAGGAAKSGAAAAADFKVVNDARAGGCHIEVSWGDTKVVRDFNFAVPTVKTDRKPDEKGQQRVQLTFLNERGVVVDTYVGREDAPVCMHCPTIRPRT